MLTYYDRRGIFSPSNLIPQVLVRKTKDRLPGKRGEVLKKITRVWTRPPLKRCSFTFSEKDPSCRRDISPNRDHIVSEEKYIIKKTFFYFLFNRKEKK